MIKGKTDTCCGAETSVYKVEALVSIDSRGQMVLPKELRDKAGIKDGDKVAISTLEKSGRVCCLLLIKADDLTGFVKDMLGPAAQEVMEK